MSYRLLMVGIGAMGSALLEGWLTAPRSKALFESFHLVNPHEPQNAALLEDSRVRWFSDASKLPTRYKPDFIVFAVKPGIIAEILPEYLRFPGTIVSVAAGKSLSFYQDMLGKERPIVRVMPNLPVAVHQGASVLLPSSAVTPAIKRVIQRCFQILGATVWAEHDDELDMATAVSGSGPAYIYLIIEALAKAAEGLGMTKEKAEKLALATVKGAAIYADASQEDPVVLRNRVTSPQGTTAAALDILQGEEGLIPLMRHAIKAAYQRARELSQ